MTERRRFRRDTPVTTTLPSNQIGYLPPDGHEFWRATLESQTEFLRQLDEEATLPLTDDDPTEDDPR